MSVFVAPTKHQHSEKTRGHLNGSMPELLFNSYVFIFAFLPITVAVFYAVGQRSNLLVDKI